MNPAFYVARDIGNNVASGFREAKDENAIERILSEAMNTGDPNVVQNSIGKILSQVSPERQKVAVQYLENVFQNIQAKNESNRKQALEQKAAQEGGYTYGAPPQVQAAQIRNQAPPKATGGLAGQPINPEITQALTNVINQNPNASADELALEFDRNNIPRAYSNSYIENRRRQDETKANNLREDKKLSRKEELEFHKETDKYDQDLIRQSQIAKSQIDTLNDITKAIESKNVKPSSWANIFKGFGKIGDKIAQALTNQDEATLLTSIPQLLE